MTFSTSLRLALLPLVVSASVLGFAHSASAATPTSSVNCKASAGVNSIVYKVNGKIVSDLRGKVGQGSSISIDFKIASGCSNVPVNISSYQAPSAVWDPSLAYKQVLVGSAVGTFNADGKVHTLAITAPNCYYQVDFGTGTPLSHITGTSNQSSMGDLISADNGGTKSCAVTTAKTVPATTTTIPKVTTTTIPKVTTTTVPKATTTTVPKVTTTTVVQNTTTTVGVQILGETVKATTPVVHSNAQLAMTGTNTLELSAYGTILILIGSAIVGLVGTIKRRRI